MAKKRSKKKQTGKSNKRSDRRADRKADKKRVDRSNKNTEPEWPPKSLFERIVVDICIFILCIFPAIMIIFCVGLVIFTGISGYIAKKEVRYTPAGSRESNVEEFGDVLYLDKIEDNSYKIVSESDDHDMELEWDDDNNFYHQDVPRVCVWYDDSSKEWKYWYMSVSGNYGDYGWMTYGHEGWQIEDKLGKLIDLPEEYNRGALWHIVEK